jgi:predicted Rossmann fold nucleotide-binding protein DprA/Smf involved in DNA uptake
MERRHGVSRARVAPVPLATGKLVAHAGIRPRGYVQADRGPTPEQLAILAALTPEPQRMCDLQTRTGRSKGSTGSSLYALQKRGLAVKVGTKWKLAKETT